MAYVPAQSKGEIPTARAVSERLVRIRSNAKSAGLTSNDFPAAKIQSGRNSNASEPTGIGGTCSTSSTPKKRAITTKSTPASAGSPSKRKFSATEDEPTEIKRELGELDDGDRLMQYPATRPKRMTTSTTAHGELSGSNRNLEYESNIRIAHSPQTTNDKAMGKSGYQNVRASTEQDAQPERTLIPTRSKREGIQNRSHEESDNDSEDTNGSHFDESEEDDDDESHAVAV